MSDTKPNPDLIDWNSAIAEMRSEKMTDDEIHKEIAKDFGSTIADQQLKRGAFSPKEVTSIWPKEWEKLTDEIPWEGPAAVAATGAALWGAKKAVGSETGQKVIRSIKDRFFSPSTPTPDPLAGPVQTPGTALNAPAVAQGAPQPVTAQEGPSVEQIRVAKQRAAQASIEGRPVVSGAGPVTQSVVESTIAPAPAQTSAEMLTNPKPELPAGTTAEQDFGKAPKDKVFVERSNVSKMSKEATAAEKALSQQGAVVPGKMKPDYPKPEGGIGVGPYHWFENQVGIERAPSLWRELFGEKNVPLKEVQEKYKQFAQSVPEGYTPRSEGVLLKRGGNFKKTTNVPDYIRGSSSIEGMARTGLGALGIMPVAHKIKEGDYKGALNEMIPAMAMIAPSLSLAASPLYTSEEDKNTLEAMRQKGFKSFKELEDYKRQVGAGRGIVPPQR